MGKIGRDKMGQSISRWNRRKRRNSRRKTTPEEAVKTLLSSPMRLAERGKEEGGRGREGSGEEKKGDEKVW